MRITVVGSVHTEMNFSVPRIPGAGEVITGSAFSISAGGGGIIVAIAAARAGGQVAFIGRIGLDPFGEQAREELNREGINSAWLMQDPFLPTGVSSVISNPSGSAAIALAPGANQSLSERDILQAKEAITGAQMLLLQLDVPIDTVKYAASMARRAGVRSILNPTPAYPVSDELLKLVSILTPGKKEAERLSGITITDERSAELAGRILLERGLSRVIINLGRQGAMVIDNGGAEHVPAFLTRSADSSWSDEVFNGALAQGLAEEQNFYEAVLFANAAAAASLQSPDRLQAIPSRSEVMRVMREVQRTH